MLYRIEFSTVSALRAVPLRHQQVTLAGMPHSSKMHKIERRKTFTNFYSHPGSLRLMKAQRTPQLEQQRTRARPAEATVRNDRAISPRVVETMQLRSESGLMTVHDAAKFLAVSTSTLYGWVYQRRIPFVKVGRALRFELAELQKFVQANRFQARA